MSHLVCLPAILLVLISSTNAALKDEYDHAAYLDVAENYKLYWSVKDADKSVHFAVEVNTTGWVGFGISAGLSGNMKGADIAIGWVDSLGKGHLKDYYSTKNGPPILDKRQDYDYVGSSETNGITVLKFKRKLVTCDKNDREIPAGTTKVIYAYGQTDNINYHHGLRGARSLNLLNYVKNSPPPASAKYFDVLSTKVSVPSEKTTYWCQAMKLSNILKLSEKKHIVEIAPLVEKKDRGLVHHMVLYVCKDDFDEAHLNTTGVCYHPNMPPSFKACIGVSPIFAWAVGGVNFKYPDHVGYPIGEADSMKYVVLETHYDNPAQSDKFVVTSGLRFYYGSPRRYDAAVLTTAAGAGSGLVIPPRQEKWIIKGYCTKECSSKLNDPRVLPGGEVRFFASFPHAHLTSNGIWTNIIRNGKEIKEVIRDENYDFNYQQSHLLREEIPFKAGDELVTYCRYNTMNRKDATIGGLSTTNEMCVNFITYYPKANLSLCMTVDMKVAYDFSKKYAQPIRKFNYTTYKNWTNVKWNNSMVNELKNLSEYQGVDAIYPICVGSKAHAHTMSSYKKPIIMKTLPPPKDVCTQNIGSNAARFTAVALWVTLSVTVISAIVPYS